MVYFIFDILGSSILVYILHKLLKTFEYNKIKTAWSASIIVILLTVIIMAVQYDDSSIDTTMFMGGLGRLDEVLWAIVILTIAILSFLILTIIIAFLYRKKFIEIYKTGVICLAIILIQTIIYLFFIKSVFYYLFITTILIFAFLIYKSLKLKKCKTQYNKVLYWIVSLVIVYVPLIICISM